MNSPPVGRTVPDLVNASIWLLFFEILAALTQHLIPWIELLLPSFPPAAALLSSG